VNHLAHALLAARTGGSITGNLMGDFVKGSPRGRYEGEVLEGILLHRRIDAFADAHPLVRRSRRRVAPGRRRYAGILVDLLYDHFLALCWEEFWSEPLPEFARRVYAELERDRALLPARMQRFADFLRRHDLLVSYREVRGIERALGGLARRLRRPNPLGEPLVELREARADFERDFRGFFPELLRAFPGRPEPGRKGSPRGTGAGISGRGERDSPANLEEGS
jgi:acyl carrier protein phosphodiesterase